MPSRTLRALASAARLAVLPLAFCLGLAPKTALAEGTVQISPVLLDLAGASVGVVNFGNLSHEPMSVQVRVFKWRQAEGRESLDPTDEIVASPPKADIAPGATLSIRVVRNAQGVPAAEDSYRLVIDQLPQAREGGKAVVAMLLRQVLPVFFSGPQRSNPSVAWTILRRDGRQVLVARNDGDRRMRIAKVALSGGGGSATLGGALLGYVLGHSAMSWTIPGKAAFAPGATVSVRGQGDSGPISANATVSASP